MTRDNTMLQHIRPAIVMILGMTMLTGLIYPLAMTGLAGVLFPARSAGGLIVRDGKVAGAAMIGQAFTAPGYFHGRPSAISGTDPADPTKTVPTPYDAANSGGSNLGPTNQALIDRVKDDATRLATENPGAKVPVDLVTTSASGLDPDISPDAALFQVPRVAKARNLPEEMVAALVRSGTEGRLFGLIGEPRVNVLRLNLALDAMHRD